MSGGSVGGAEAVLSFWLDEVGPEGWYEASDALDARVRDRFEDPWEAAMEGGLGLWLTDPRGALAYVILTDQFPRNMFRGTARSFASDPHARTAAKMAVGRDWDLRVPEPGRQFFYLPLMHSENLVDQDRCVRLFAARLPEVGPAQMVHARAHREQIRRFGRFPMRNEALGRKSTPAEAAFLSAGGYKALLEEMGAPG
jgi:uncharacterized protein (DUF924 family)